MNGTLLLLGAGVGLYLLSRRSAAGTPAAGTPAPGAAAVPPSTPSSRVTTLEISSAYVPGPPTNAAIGPHNPPRAPATLTPAAGDWRHEDSGLVDYTPAVSDGVPAARPSVVPVAMPRAVPAPGGDRSVADWWQILSGVSPAVYDYLAGTPPPDGML